MLKGRVIPVHNRLSHHGGHLLCNAPLSKFVQKGFLNHVPDCPLRVCSTDVQGNEGKLMTGKFPSSVDETYLRTIAVSDHDAQPLCNEIGNILRCFLHGFILPG